MALDLTTRAAKGAPLTHAEMDANWTAIKGHVDSIIGGFVADRTALAAADTAQTWILTEDGRDGMFQWDATVPIATHTADSRQGVYVAPNAAADGAWVRQFNGRLSPRWFGAKADGTTDDSAAINAAMSWMRRSYNATLGVYQWQVDGEGLCYGVASPIDCCEVAYGRGAGVFNMVVNASCPGKSAFDFTGSRFLHLDGLVVRGAMSLASCPAIGFYFGRLSTGATSDGHAIGDIEAYGYFSTAGIVNYASEVFQADSIRVANHHPAATSTGAIFTGHDDTIFNHCGVRPSSDFKTVQTGSESMSDAYVDRLNLQRVSAYTYAITSISKANPAVVSVAPASLAAAAASYGLANGTSIFLDSIVGSDAGATGFARSIGFRCYTVANLDTVAGTFELSGCDTSAVTGTYTSGYLRNDTGPALVIGQTGILRANGYIEAYSKARVKVDVRNSTDWMWDVEIVGRHETAGRNSIEFVGDSTARSVKRFTYRTDNQLAVVAPIAITGCSGAGVITFTDCEFVTGRAAQVPSTTFENPQWGNFRNARVQVQAASLVQTPDAFAGFTGVWHADDTAIPIAVGTQRNLSNVGTDTQALWENTDAGNTTGSTLDVYRNSASPAAFDLLSRLVFSGNNSALAKKLYAYLRTQIVSATAGAEKGAFGIFVQEGGADTLVGYFDGRGLQRINRTASNANDADISLTATAHHVQQFLTGTLTADRTLTLSTSGAGDGDRFMVARTGGGAFVFNVVGPGALCSLTQNQWAEFVYDGTAAAWKLVRFGILNADGIEGTDGSATAGPDYYLYRRSPSPAANDLLARLLFQGNNDAGTKKNYAYWRGQAQGVTAGAENGALTLFGLSGGADVQLLHADGRGLQGIDKSAVNPNDADVTLTSTAHHVQQFFTGTLTADRTLTLSAAAAVDGYRFMITRLGAGAFNLNVVGPGALCSLSQNQWAEFVYSETGATWKLARRGDLTDAMAAHLAAGNPHSQYLLKTGGTMTGKLAATITATTEGVNVGQSASDPSAPSDGAVWVNGTSWRLMYRTNGFNYAVANKDTANTFNPGSKQTVSHDATTAGLNIAPVAGDPSTPVDGDVWYNLTAGKFRKKEGGAVSDLDTGGGTGLTHLQTMSRVFLG